VGNSVTGYGIGSGDQHHRAGARRSGLLTNPRTFAAGHGLDAIDDRQIHRTRGDYIGHDVSARDKPAS